MNMRKSANLLIVCTMILTLFLGAGVANAGKSVPLFGDRLSIILPSGMNLVSAEIAREKYPNGKVPDYVFANKQTTTSIAVSLVPSEMPESQLPEFHKGMANNLSTSLPGIEWLKQDIIDLNEMHWGVLEFMSQAPDGEIHNIMLLGVFDGYPLIFNFNSTKEDYKLMADELLKSMFSIKRTKPQTSGKQPLPPPNDPVIAANSNTAGVHSGPKFATAFGLKTPHLVTYMHTYHYFNNGKPPGTITLRCEDGSTYGPWQAEGVSGQGNVPNAYWVVRPNVVIKPGICTIMDSDPSTWSYNTESKDSGFFEIRGKEQLQ